MRILKEIWLWFKCLFKKEPRPSIILMVTSNDLPLAEEMSTQRLYLVGAHGSSWALALLCPCGCREPIYLNLLPDRSPYWRVMDSGRTVTVLPSIWRKNGCKSHFFVRDSQIDWCNGRN